MENENEKENEKEKKFSSTLAYFARVNSIIIFFNNFNSQKLNIKI